MFSSKIPEKGQIMLVISLINHSETYLPRIYEADKRFVYSLAISWHLIFFLLFTFIAHICNCQTFVSNPIQEVLFAGGLCISSPINGTVHV